MSEPDFRVDKVSLKTLLRALDCCTINQLPFLKLGVATYLKARAGECCTFDEIAAWVWPAGVYPEDTASVLKVIVTRLRQDGAPIERKNNRAGAVVVSRPRTFRWEPEHVG